MPENKNMELWNKVCETDPANTKHVAQRGGFTAIGAHSQIKAATEQFGPVGEGWWWVTEDQVQGDLFIVKVQLFRPDHRPVVQYGCAEMNPKRRDGSTYLDSDAPKKATTDGLTKCLSYLGFNADIFLGKWDDNKYVAEMEEKFKGKKPAPKAPPRKPNPKPAAKVTFTEAKLKLQEVVKGVLLGQGADDPTPQMIGALALDICKDVCKKPKPTTLGDLDAIHAVLEDKEKLEKYMTPASGMAPDNFPE